MKVLDPGHRYELDGLDGATPQVLQFVKRSGAGYPGNVGTTPGVIIQEVLRALIDRGLYVNAQIPSDETTLAIRHLRIAFQLLEQRAARRHGRDESRIWFESEPERSPVHAGCGHVGCAGECGRATDVWREGPIRALARAWFLQRTVRRGFVR